MVWVRFLELPLKLLDEEVLYAVGNTLGRTVNVDATTLAAARGKYARVCIEIDLAKPLIPHIGIFGCQQRVEYEGLHLICFRCGKYGHRAGDCQNSEINKQAQLEKDAAVEVQQSEKEEEQHFGTWMLSKHSRPRHSKGLSGQQKGVAARTNGGARAN